MEQKRYPLLENIHSPEDVQKLSVPQLEELAAQVRRKLISVVSKTGGHLASNLGVVELTLAIHKVFHSPVDQIVWDVGHQAYTHKLITGRLDKMGTLRQKDGISGFPRIYESPHDVFTAGHSSNSISAALGLLEAKRIQHKPGEVVAVIGDGALTGGLAFEGLNNAARSGENLVVIINDNSMSISKNVGALSSYLSDIRTEPGYFRMKDRVEKVLDHTPVVGKPIKNTILRSKSLIKDLIYQHTFFEDLGFVYLGPVDGHDIGKLINVLRRASDIKGPVIVHVNTIKGKGYSYAEENPGAYHGISKFNVETGNPDIMPADTFSDEFGKALAELADYDPKICGITAAMKYGTGMQHFARAHRDRFFDVGIAEQHGVTFSAGLAANGMVPVFAVYSSFLQRGYDQIIHDAAIDDRHIVLGIDRAGLVGEDGETHQGLFDVPFLLPIPNVCIYGPATYEELRYCLKKAVAQEKGIVAVRYPRGSQPKMEYTFHWKDYDCIPVGGEGEKDLLLITYGRVFAQVLTAAKRLSKEGRQVQVLKLLRLSPVDPEVYELIKGYKNVVFVEEGMRIGGLGEQFALRMMEDGFGGSFHIHAIGKEFIHQSSVAEAMASLGLDAQGIYQFIKRVSLEREEKA